MDNRRYSRLDINLKAELIYNSNCYKGVIENFSNGGLGIRSAPSEELDGIKPGDNIVVRFQANPKDVLSISYKIKWLVKLPLTPFLCQKAVWSSVCQFFG